MDLASDRLTPLDAGACRPVADEASAAKGATSERTPREVDRWAIEGTAGVVGRPSDAFTDRLQTFGYRPKGGLVDFGGARFALRVTRSLAPHIAAVARIGTLGGDTYQRSVADSTDTASLSAYGASLSVRVFTDVAGRWLGVYGQAGAGMSLGALSYQTDQTNVPRSSTTFYPSYLLEGAVGVTVRFRHLVTLLLEAGYDRAPAIHDLTGDTHDSGGPSLALGLRFRAGDGP
jgi:hypothetical protein